METVLTIIIMISSLLLIGAVLLQPGKGDLTATFGGLSSQIGSAFGMQKATDLLGKITKWLFAIIAVLVLATNFIIQYFDDTPDVQKAAIENVDAPAAHVPVPSAGQMPVQVPETAPAEVPAPAKEEGTE
jgi:protein translocase SecG subunit